MLFLEMLRRFSSGLNLPRTGCLFGEGHFGLVWASAFLQSKAGNLAWKQSGNLYCQVDFEVIQSDFEVIQYKDPFRGRILINQIMLPVLSLLYIVQS